MQTAANGIKRHETGTVEHGRRGLRLARAVAGGLVATVVTLLVLRVLALAWAAAYAGVVAPGPASADEILMLVAASLAWAVAGWLGLGTALGLLAHVPGRVGRVAAECAERLTPALARRVAAFVLGVGVGVVGGPGQAVAAPRGGMPSAAASASAPHDGLAPLDPGFVPTSVAAGDLTTSGDGTAYADPGFMPTSPAATAPEPGFTPAPPSPGFTPSAPRVRPQADPGLIAPRPRPDSDGDEVVVHRGDSLWSIAARHLGPDATDAEIARAWPQWYAANRPVIGGDPDLLLPGQILKVPTLSDEVSVTR
ncbi:hypothetical protein BCF74_1065 [Knoellia remsis]|uniref:LysM domain-containing protein n=1 Tax=Knoellia remsis TaxID=407159 RepID=A0A2T0UTT8_9MICO|nr:LysM peptidoglycan-binding domain-containing protein [Knoellia remsis]PRY61257.1 hypothetical protein BCF74_1065 [Knoellia remsis]